MPISLEIIVICNNSIIIRVAGKTEYKYYSYKKAEIDPLLLVDYLLFSANKIYVKDEIEIKLCGSVSFIVHQNIVYTNPVLLCRFPKIDCFL